MAGESKITIRVTSSRGASVVSYSSNGRYVSFVTSGYQRQLLSQPIQPTSSLKAFWASVLGIVLADVEANG